MPISVDFQNSMTEIRSGNQFEYLATEILLQIISHVPDLVSLDSLIRAPPVAFRVFGNYAVEIMDTVLSSSGLTNGHVQAILRIIALIRSSALPIQNLQEFRRVTIEAVYWRVRPSKNGFAPERFLKTASPVVLRSILATHRQITCVALDHLKGCLARFRALRPEHLVDEKIQIL